MRSEEDRTEYCSNILMMKSELEDRRSSIAELDAKVQELEMHNEYQLRVKDMTYAEQMKNITENAQEDMRTERKKYEELEHEKARTETRHREELMKLRDIQHHELQRIEAEYQQMIMSQVELYQELKQEVASESKRIAKDQDTLIESNEKEVRMAAIENQKKIETVRSLRNRAEEELGLTRRTCDEEATQLNTDIDVEIQDLKRKYVTFNLPANKTTRPANK
jgi:cilia- and flagella-associated protein 57